MNYKTVDLYEAEHPAKFDAAMRQSIGYLMDIGTVETPKRTQGTLNFVSIGKEVAYTFQVAYPADGKRQLSIRIFGDTPTELDARVDQLLKAVTPADEEAQKFN